MSPVVPVGTLSGGSPYPTPRVVSGPARVRIGDGEPVEIAGFTLRWSPSAVPSAVPSPSRAGAWRGHVTRHGWRVLAGLLRAAARRRPVRPSPWKAAHARRFGR